jgi:hypothetical protein
MTPGAGEFLAANIMISMMPEELIIEKALEELQTYKLQKDLGVSCKPPEAAVVALIMKWKTLGKTPQQIIDDVKQVESAKNIMDSFNSTSN